MIFVIILIYLISLKIWCNQKSLKLTNNQPLRLKKLLNSRNQDKKRSNPNQRKQKTNKVQLRNKLLNHKIKKNWYKRSNKYKRRIRKRNKRKIRKKNRKRSRKNNSRNQRKNNKRNKKRNKLKFNKQNKSQKQWNVLC